MSVGSRDLFQVALWIAVEFQNVAFGIMNLIGRTLSQIPCVVRLGKENLGTVGKFHGPAVAVPAGGCFVEARRSFGVLEDGVGVTGALGDAIEIQEICVFKDDGLVRIRIARADGSNIVRMIAIAAEGMDGVLIDPFIGDVSSSEGNLEYVVDEKVGFTEHEVSIPEVRFESVDGKDMG